jgi:methionyl-tRNA formyltransferase
MSKQKIPILFIGTADIGAPLLRALSADQRFEVKLVVSQPDKPAGRKLELQPTPIKAEALKLGLPVFQPEKINKPEALDELRKHKPEMIVLMAYGKILKKELLDLPPLGCINVHASLLPRHRGASPIQNCLLAGDSKTGISIMRMGEGLDDGPVFKTFEIPILAEDNAESIWEKLAQLTAEKTPDTLVQIADGKLIAKPQDDSKATTCTLIDKTDGEIKWGEPAETILRKIRAYAGWPGTYTFWNEKRLKILKAKASDLRLSDKPGTVTQKDSQIIVATGKGAIELIELQLEGKKAQPIGEFMKGQKGFAGCQLAN